MRSWKRRCQRLRDFTPKWHGRTCGNFLGVGIHGRVCLLLRGERPVSVVKTHRDAATYDRGSSRLAARFFRRALSRLGGGKARGVRRRLANGANPPRQTSFFRIGTTKRVTILTRCRSIQVRGACIFGELLKEGDSYSYSSAKASCGPHSQNLAASQSSQYLS